jgi:glycerophosphoryl diester phosphodiesterase
MDTQLGFGQKIDVQGHRGARGLMPENTIPAFLLAVDLGVTTLELDVVVSKDKKVVLSHEPYFSSEICLKPHGHPIPKEDEKNYNIYDLNYSEIKSFDCGLKEHPRFPHQKKIPAFKPLLEDVIDIVEKYIKDKNLPPVNYNIELKSTLETEGLFHPNPSEFSKTVYSVIQKRLPKNRVVIQSFDVRVLQYWNANLQGYALSYLVEDEADVDRAIEKLGFVPPIYSPDYNLLDESKVQKIKSLNMKLIPWTVNDTADIQKVLSFGVDGIISDYPDRVLQILSK